MKLIYATSFSGSAGTAHRMQVLSMAQAFYRLLGGKFYLGAGDIGESVKIQIINLGGKNTRVLAWRYLKFSQAKQISHIYCREPKLLLFIALFNLLWFRQKIKFIYEVHTIPIGVRSISLINRLLTFFISKYVFVTEHLAKRYAKRYNIFSSDQNKIVIAHDGVNLDIFDLNISPTEARTKLDLPIERKVIGYTGRFKTMEMEKGISDILKSLRNLPTEVLFLAVGGKKKHRDEYLKQAQQLGVEGKVNLIEHFSQDIVALYQKACDILLMPFPYTEHYAYYMSPLKMFEYMASQRPIIASDLPSVREILNESNAILIPPDNPTALAEAITHLLAHPAIGEKLAAQAYRDVQNYTWDKRAGRIIEAIV